MAKIIHMLEYCGHIDYKMIDRLLKDLRENKDYRRLGKTISKRVYAIIVECLENIAKHSIDNPGDDPASLPFISVKSEDGLIVIRAGNPILREKIQRLDVGLDLINTLEDRELLSLYDSKINMHHESGANGAGLGFMLMKLKSRNNIGYRYTGINKKMAFFEIKITITQHIMRKLIIDQTSNSPRVVFDPDIHRYEISGESRPPDVAGFYSDIITWFDDFSKQLLKSDEDTRPLIVDLDFEYFNSSSAKYILDFCKKIAEVKSKGKDITVKWHYEDDDYDMLETGREMSKMAKFPFEYIVKGKK